MGRVGGRFFAAIATGTVAAVGFSASAQAAVTTTATSPQHVFVVGDDAADAMRIECVQDELKVNGADPPQSAVSCATLIKLEVTGGGGDDLLDLSRLDYRLIALRKAKKPLKISVNGGEGNDQVAAGAGVGSAAGGPGADSLTSFGGVLLRTMEGGPGPDVMQGGGVSEVLTGGPGRDTLQEAVAPTF